MELASCGYIVFVPDHLDGSCTYTELKNGDKKWFNIDMVHHEKDITPFHKTLEQRVTEVSWIIDEFSKPEFLKDVLNFPAMAKLNMNKLIVSGHSMGGATVIKLAEKDDRANLIMAQDPWLHPIKDEID